MQTILKRLLVPVAVCLLVANVLPEADPWFFVGTGDSHFSSDRVPVFEQVVEDLNRRRPEFLALLGDGVDTASAQSFTLLTAACAKLQVPIHYVIGNHDVLVPGKQNDRSMYLKARATITPDAPSNRTYYAFTHRNCRFIALDTAGDRPEHWGIRVSDPNQWAWFEDELKSAQSGFDHIFVMMHVPSGNPLAQLVTRRNHWFADAKEAKEFEALMTRYKVSMVLCAHDHMFLQFNKGGIPYTLCGSAGGRIAAPAMVGGFFNYVEVHIDGKTVTTKVVPVLRSVTIETQQRSAAPGKSIVLTAVGTQPDGTKLRLTPPMSFRWSSSNSKIGTVDASGKFTARSPGATKVSVVCGRQKEEVEIVVES